MQHKTLSILLSLASAVAFSACADLDDPFDHESFRVDVASEQDEQLQGHANYDLYGNAVATYGSHALVGAPRRNVGLAEEAGVVETWEFDAGDWNRTGLLTYSEPDDNQSFGESVDVYGNWAIVGMPNYWGARGRAVVYEYSGGAWVERAIFSPTGNGAPYDQFGASVAMSGPYAIVGVPGEDGATTNSGSVYVYRRSGSTWTEIQQVAPTSPKLDGNFGYEVDIEPNGYRFVASAANVFKDDPGGIAPADYDGDAEVFVRSGAGGTFVSEDEMSGPGAGYGFGTAVAISGDVLIGQPGGSVGAGAAKLYTRSGSTWSLDTTFTAPSPATGDRFGEAVALPTGDHAYISAPPWNNVGRVYEFVDDNGWSQVDAFSSAYVPLRFGAALAASVSHVVVGDTWYDTYAGRVHFFEADPEEIGEEPNPGK